MSRFTKCQPAARRPNALPPTTVFKIMLVLTVVLGFGVAHIHLRVRLSRLRRDISTLQSDQGRLLSEINGVRTENEALKTPNIRWQRKYRRSAHMYAVRDCSASLSSWAVPRRSWRFRRGWRSSPAWPLPWLCWDSTCWGTVCGTCWTPS